MYNTVSAKNDIVSYFENIFPPRQLSILQGFFFDIWKGFLELKTKKHK